MADGAAAIFHPPPRPAGTSPAGGEKKRIFLVGSDYVYPWTANFIAKKYLKAKGLEPVGEEYVPLGNRDFSAAMKKIREAPADCVVNTVNGDSNLGFFAALAEAGTKPVWLPVVSTSIAEDELRSLLPEQVVGHYAAWCTSGRRPWRRPAASRPRRCGRHLVRASSLPDRAVGCGSIRRRSIRQSISGSAGFAPTGSLTSSISHGGRLTPIPWAGRGSGTGQRSPRGRRAVCRGPHRRLKLSIRRPARSLLSLSLLGQKRAFVYAGKGKLLLCTVPYWWQRMYRDRIRDAATYA